MHDLICQQGTAAPSLMYAMCPPPSFPSSWLASSLLISSKKGKPVYAGWLLAISNRLALKLSMLAPGLLIRMSCECSEIQAKWRVNEGGEGVAGSLIWSSTFLWCKDGGALNFFLLFCADQPTKCLTNQIWLRLRNSTRASWRRQKRKRKTPYLLKKVSMINSCFTEMAF